MGNSPATVAANSHTVQQAPLITTTVAVAVVEATDTLQPKRIGAPRRLRPHGLRRRPATAAPDSTAVPVTPSAVSVSTPAAMPVSTQAVSEMKE